MVMFVKVQAWWGLSMLHYNNMKRISILYFVFCILAIILSTYYILHTTNQIPPAFAQTSGTCSTNNTRAVVQGGLTSTSRIDISNNLVTNSGVCIIDPKAAFAPYKIPSYDELKSLYYTQAKTTASVTKQIPIGTGNEAFDESSIDLSGTKDNLYFINGYLTRRSGTIIPQDANQRVGVVFVEKDLSIQGNIGYPGGLVFIVKGNVNINQSVTQVDAVIISEGIICTAYDGSTCPSTNVTASPLVINGSLISLREPPTADPNASYIKFKRILDPSAANNNRNTPAEQINYQPKYLVILRNLMSDTIQRWSEIQ